MHILFIKSYIYSYELQIEEGFRGAGLGRFMLQILELIAFTNKMSKVVLTAFKHNDDALNFYTKCRLVLSYFLRS